MDASRAVGRVVLALIVVVMVMGLLVAVACVDDSEDSSETSGSDVADGVAVRSEPPELSGFRRDAWFLPSDGLLGFVEIPAGPFVMGSDPRVDPLAFENERWSAEQTQGIVDLPGYYIGRTEITVAQFRAFVDATGGWVDPRAMAAPPDHPVTFVSWPDALAYCRWLDRTLESSPGAPAELAARVRSGWRIGLPTEAQWEKAARGGDGRIYPWGNEPSVERANYRRRTTAPVGSFACGECAFGLADMSGNVWELTRSYYHPYPFNDADEPADLSADALWVMRGGHFGDADQNVRSAIRGGIDPGARRAFVGFRIVLSPP